MSTVVNTHHHGDHTNGNYLAGAATIIGHRNTRELMIATGIQHYEQAFEGINWGELQPRPPDVTFEDTLTLYAGDTRVELRYVGNAAHTTNDVLVWLPEQSILFAGDLNRQRRYIVRAYGFGRGLASGTGPDSRAWGAHQRPGTWWCVRSRPDRRRG